MAVSLEIPLKVATDLPRPGELGVVFLPGQVAELDGVLALVGNHLRMHHTAIVVLVQGPKTADAGLRIKYGNIKGSLGHIVKE